MQIPMSAAIPYEKNNIIFQGELDHDLFHVHQPPSSPITFNFDGRVYCVPKNRPKPKKTITKQCKTCGNQVLKKSYEAHRRRCEHKETLLKERLPPLRPQTSLNEMKRYIRIKELDVDWADHRKSSVFRNIERVENPWMRGEWAPVSKAGFAVTCKSCDICGQVVLPEGYTFHVKKCLVKQQSFLREPSLPNLGSTLPRSVKAFAKSRNLQDFEFDIDAETVSTAVESIESAMRPKFESLSNPCLKCDSCNAQVLRHGYALHRKKCIAKTEAWFQANHSSLFPPRPATQPSHFSMSMPTLPVHLTVEKQKNDCLLRSKSCVEDKSGSSNTKEEEKLLQALKDVDLSPPADDHLGNEIYRADCPKSHGLSKITVPEGNGCSSPCSVCRSELRAGAAAFACAPCDYSQCVPCFQRALGADARQAEARVAAAVRLLGV